MLNKLYSIAAIAAIFSAVAITPKAMAATFRVSIENLAPTSGNFLTSVWVGFHNGEFDIYNRGESLEAFPGTENVAEDGDTGPITAQFSAIAAGTVQGTLPGPSGPIAPGEIASFDFDLDPTDIDSRYFSYASMIIPSNDAFIANGNPLAHQIFDDMGNFLGADFTVLGSQVLDGGTEVNDEAEFSTAFLGQATPDTGIDENGVVELHPGFVPGGRILSTPRFAEADFTTAGYEVARIKVEKVPEPGTIAALIGVGTALMASKKFRRFGASA
ncbi:MAG: PEP-CTERM sorting domain-containing protein [Leptolyngbyaceae cyanobacterium SL_1_1]|nr:PEP-CTERM sorting domain-containing protein [Leptolyngbyaceae cyanobacterium RM1_1_2]NJO10058.1 PEP-CTERM sorting domain-containing protein [Leptolyngbyaceae cyanobacterium SL_1_1]